VAKELPEFDKLRKQKLSLQDGNPIYRTKSGVLLQPTDFGLNRYSREMVCDCGECPMCRYYELMEARWNVTVPSRQALLDYLAQHEPDWAELIEIHMRMCWQVQFQSMVDTILPAILPDLIRALVKEGFVRAPPDAYLRELLDDLVRQAAPAAAVVAGGEDDA